MPVMRVQTAPEDDGSAHNRIGWARELKSRRAVVGWKVRRWRRRGNRQLADSCLFRSLAAPAGPGFGSGHPGLFARAADAVLASAAKQGPRPCRRAREG